MSKHSVVLGSDTVVVCDDRVLEKPKSFEDSKRMLTDLSGRRHQVMRLTKKSNNIGSQESHAIKLEVMVFRDSEGDLSPESKAVITL